jgi:hypothetical protein
MIFYQIPGQDQTNEIQEIPPRSVQLSICGCWIVCPISAQTVQIPVTTYPPSSPLMSRWKLAVNRSGCPQAIYSGARRAAGGAFNRFQHRSVIRRDRLTA